MRPQTTSRKRERLEARITAEQKALFLRAAELSGRSLTDFVISAVQSAAEEMIERHLLITLSARDSLYFAEALFSQDEPNEHLRAAARRHRALVRDAE